MQYLLALSDCTTRKMRHFMYVIIRDEIFTCQHKVLHVCTITT